MYLTEVYGKGGIYAKMVAASIANDIPLYTMELRYHRFIHAESKTHRILSLDDKIFYDVRKEVALMDDPNLSRNASSSRAIPVNKIIKEVRKNPAMPITATIAIIPHSSSVGTGKVVNIGCSIFLLLYC